MHLAHSCYLLVLLCLEYQPAYCLLAGWAAAVADCTCFVLIVVVVEYVAVDFFLLHYLLSQRHFFEQNLCPCRLIFLHYLPFQVSFGQIPAAFEVLPAVSELPFAFYQEFLWLFFVFLPPLLIFQGRLCFRAAF